MTDEEFEEEYEDEIEELEAQLKLAVKALEILYEELEKSNLPEDVKKAILLAYKANQENK